MAETGSVPLWWVVLFLLLALGAGAVAVWTAGGNLIDSGAGAFVLPLLLH